MNGDHWWQNAQAAGPAARGLPAPQWGDSVRWEATAGMRNFEAARVQVVVPRPWALWIDVQGPAGIPVVFTVDQASGRLNTQRIFTSLPGQMVLPIVGQTVRVTATAQPFATPGECYASAIISDGVASQTPLTSTTGRVVQYVVPPAGFVDVPGDVGSLRTIYNFGPDTANYEITPGITSGRILLGGTVQLPYTGPIRFVDFGGAGSTVNVTTFKA